MRRKRAVQRIVLAIPATGNRLRMADMVRPAGEQEPLQRMIDTRITVVRDRSARRDIDLSDEAGADVENGTLVQKQTRPHGRRKRLHLSSSLPDSKPVTRT